MPSLNTGGYAKARQRLPEAVLCQLFEHTGKALCNEATEPWLWQGRIVKILDGSNVVMADTAANQAAYPQHKNQKAGCGFPIAKLVVVFSLATAAAIAVRIADFKTSEIALARQWYRTLATDDIALADRAYGSYVDLALVAAQKADGVFRKHQRRNSDFRRGKRLGKKDHIVTWFKPVPCPNGMPPDEFKALPETLRVRELHFSIRKAGQRTKNVTVVTTLLDPKAYSKAQVTQLYGLRWQVEIDLGHVKTTLKMEMIQAQSPEMVRKEIYVHLMAYNLLRYLMWQAAVTKGDNPLRLSVQGTRQSFNQYRDLLADAGKRRCGRYGLLLLDMVAKTVVSLRPNRHEPRKRKRRPKAFPLMNEPRAILKQKLITAR